MLGVVGTEVIKVKGFGRNIVRTQVIRNNVVKMPLKKTQTSLKQMSN
jgi:hypothetical protein